jgi:uncharacterized membrane protein (UPF0127 family)
VSSFRASVAGASGGRRYSGLTSRKKLRVGHGLVVALPRERHREDKKGFDRWINAFK